MRDKRDIMIVILVIIIFAGGGYFLGTKNRIKNDSKQVNSTSSSVKSNESSSIKLVESTTQTSTKDMTEETQKTDPSLSQEEIAFNKMVSLQGKWGVPQSGRMFTIHEDGTWSSMTVGVSEPRIINVTAESYNAMTDTLYVSIDGESAQIHIITKEHIIIDYNDGTPPVDYVLVS